MVKINWRSLGQKESWYQLLRRARLMGHELPRWLFIRHSHAIDLIAVGIGLMVAAYLVLVLVFRSPVAPDGQIVRAKDLSVETLTNLDAWADERQRERERPIELKRSEIFK